ncbi:thermonuclease family protein [Thiomicrorhabdus sp. Kp2]|uniref:thermonuclease family protein n=1 Tax=Thiomicrorhabdus sp. Kp2 TaxID=1123518 RepID=UPI0003FEEB27|nr:thermonuclease family protein [Thiomicrorhabdus sp. Kp2]
MIKLAGRVLFIFCLFALAEVVQASGKSYGPVVVDEVTSIYDGDTFRVNINAWPAIVGQRIPVRVKGIDTPELRGKCQLEKELARKAKQHTVQMLRGAKRIELQDIDRGKYFRILADVSIDGQDLGKSLIRNGLAVSYDGRTKTDWCQ